MPTFDSPFGSGPFGGPLPTNLPVPKGLPQGTSVQAGSSRPAPMMLPPDMSRPAPIEAAPRSELESIISGIGGLWKQSREDAEKKKSAADIKTVLDSLAAMKAGKNVTMAPATAADEKTPRDFAPTDVDEYMKRNAKFESGSSTDAVNPGSGATGLYQFLPSTWNWIAKEAPELGLTPEGMKDRDQQNKAMRYYTDKSMRTLAPILGRKPTGGELYLLHLLGHSGGPAVLSDLDAPITKTISSAAYRGNPFLKQYETGRELIAGLNHTFGG